MAAIQAIDTVLASPWSGFLVARALSDMNPRRRKIFLLHRTENLTYAEIGETVGMSEKGVKKQMAKALLELRCAVGHQT